MRCIGALVAIASAGCITALPPGTARTLPRGAWQVNAAQTDVIVSQRSDVESGTSHLFGPELGIRYGVTDRVEVGGRLVPMGGALGAKFAVLRAPTAENGIDLAIAPEGFVLGEVGQAGDQNWIALVQVPVLVGISLRGHQLVGGVHLAQMLQQSTSLGTPPSETRYRRDVTVVGTSLGLAFRVTRGFRIYPQAGIGWPAREHVVTTSAPAGYELPRLSRWAQASLGFLLGGE